MQGCNSVDLHLDSCPGSALAFQGVSDIHLLSDLASLPFDSVSGDSVHQKPMPEMLSHHSPI